MKKCLQLVWMVCLASCAGSQSEEGVKLTGALETFGEGSLVYAERISETGPIKEDSVEVKSDGTFTFYLDVPAPSFYRLNFDDRQIVSLILTGKETEVTVNADGGDPRGFSELSGSYDTDFKNRMEAIMQAYQQERAG